MLQLLCNVCSEYIYKKGHVRLSKLYSVLYVDYVVLKVGIKLTHNMVLSFWHFIVWSNKILNTLDLKGNINIYIYTYKYTYIMNTESIPTYQVRVKNIESSNELTQFWLCILQGCVCSVFVPKQGKMYIFQHLIKVKCIHTQR